MARFCPQCGLQVSETDKFCPECGAPLPQENENVSEPKPKGTPVISVASIKASEAKRKNESSQQPEAKSEPKPEKTSGISVSSIKANEAQRKGEPATATGPALEKRSGISASSIKANETVRKAAPAPEPAVQPAVKKPEPVQTVTEKPEKRSGSKLFAKLDKPDRKEQKKGKKIEEKPVQEIKLQEPKKKKKKRFRLGKLILVLLVFALLFEAVNFVLFNPGIDEVKEMIYGLIDGKEYDDDYFPPDTVFDSEQINVTFSAEEVSKAKETRSKVSENSYKANAFDLKVDMTAYNLYADDELIVKNLGTKSDQNSGWSIEAFDFSLASGINEFPSHVVISFPVNKDDDAYTSFGYYNESTHKWEDLYYERSEDGKYYQVYIDHFTKVGKMQRLFNLKQPLSRTNSEIEQIMARKGITLDLFFESKLSLTKNHMLWPVHLDKTALFEKLYNNSLTNVEKAVKNFHNQSISLKKVFESLNNPIQNEYSEYSGYFGAGLTANDMTKFVLKDSKALEYLGVGLSGIDAGLALYAIADEIRLKPTTTTMDLLKNRWNELITIGASVASVIPVSKVVSLKFGAITLAWWFGTYCYEQMGKINEYNPSLKEPEERFYNYYLHPDHNINVTLNHPYKTDLDGLMKKPPSMSDAEFKIFIEDMRKIPGIRGGKPESWLTAFKSILKIYENKPEMVPTIIDELYEKYARSYFDLSKADRQKWQKTASPKLAINESDYREFTYTETIELVSAMKQKMQIETAGVLLQAYKDMEMESRREFSKFIREYIDKPMNSEIRFRIVDDSLPEGESFSKSRYYVDYTKLEKNRDALSKKKYDQLITPMRFAGVTKPLLIPDQPNGKKGSKKYYYPYKDNFLPQIRDDDIVFRTTLYHWIMMGSPTQMIFKDVNSSVANDLIAAVSDVSGDKNMTTMTIHVNPGLSLDPYLGLWEDVNKKGYIALAYSEGKVVYYEGNSINPGKEWVVVDCYNIDPKTKVLTLYSEKFVGPAKITLVDNNTISMPDQHTGMTLKLKRISD